jgi:hypothetical protein
MTVAVKPRVIDYLENGVTLDFAVPWKFNDPEDIRALRTSAGGVQSALAYGTDYSVAGGVDDTGGTLSVTTPAVTGTMLSIWSETPRSQTADYATNDTFPAETHEQRLDNLAMVDQEQDAELDRAPKFPRGATVVDFADLSDLEDGDILEYRGGKLQRKDTTGFSGKFYGGAAGSGSMVPLSGSGADAALRGDLAEETGPDLIGSPEVGASFGDFHKRWRRYYEALAGVSVAAMVALAPNQALAGNGVPVAAALAFAEPILWRLDEGCEISGIEADGSHMTGAAWSGAGIQAGGAIYASGTSSADRLDGLKIEGKFSNFANGTINLQYVDNLVAPRLALANIQTLGAATNTCAGLEVYYGRNYELGALSAIGYTKKAFSFNYLQDSTIELIRTKGGVVGQSSAHFFGGERVRVDKIIHDGDINTGYGPKLVDTRQCDVGTAEVINAQDSFQVYGGHATIGVLESKDQSNAALMIDAYQARAVVGGSPTSECDVRVGQIISQRGASSSISASALYIRADDTTGTPIYTVEVARLYVRGGYSAAYMPTVYGTADTLHIGTLDVDQLDAAGYIYFGLFKNVVIDELIVGANVKQGIVAYTCPATRGGTFHIKKITVNTANSAWTTEPLIRLGYPGATGLSECGFETVIIENVTVDGNLAANLKLLDIRAHTADLLKTIILRNITGTNLVATEQIGIYLKSTATNVRLFMDNVTLLDASGNLLNINIDQASKIVGGNISNLRGTFTAGSRPAACNPYYSQATIDLSAVASGATSSDQLAAVTGAAAGDQVTVIPRTAKVATIDAWINAGNQVGFTVKNRTAGALGVAEVFDIFVSKRTVT